MIDWHSHILPELDDGSRSVAESIYLINMQKAQGVGTVKAIPHFYADDESVESFLERREKAFELLKSQLPEDCPQIKTGAEVLYYQGISRLAGLKSLRIEGSRLLLLEMPMLRWTEYMLRELEELASISGLTIILAHIERYLDLQNEDTWDRLYESGFLNQVNASFFIAFASRRKALSLLKQGRIHFVGSDCHNVTSRPPRIGQAFEYIQKKLGGDFITQMNEYGYSMLEHK